MKKVMLLSLSILLICLAYSFAEVPCKINYQGRLIKDNVPVDGTKTMNFSIYNDLEFGDRLWTSGDVSVQVHNGLFRYVLGSGGTDLSGIDWTAGQTLYLEVIVAGEKLTPREELSAYPYAINSHLLEGETKEYFLNTSAETQTKQGNLNIMGNLGIGTNDPKEYLHLHNSGSVSYMLITNGWIGDTQTDGLRIGTTAYGNGLIWLYENAPLRFATNNQDRVRIDETGNVGIGTTSPEAKLDVNGEIKCSGFADHFGMNWHEAVAEKHNSVGWATAVDYSGPGILLFVQGYGRWLDPLTNHIRITIDGGVWRDYTGIARTAGANGWNVLDDSDDENSGVITLMPFKKFSSGLKVEIYNAYSTSESSVRVNYLTP